MFAQPRAALRLGADVAVPLLRLKVSATGALSGKCGRIDRRVDRIAEAYIKVLRHLALVPDDGVEPDRVPAPRAFRG